MRMHGALVVAAAGATDGGHRPPSGLVVAPPGAPDGGDRPPCGVAAGGGEVAQPTGSLGTGSLRRVRLVP
eukprot:1195115-Prorocentrum_minimum.AAC.1